jgi:transcriptional regulator with XRE-family HTH domain
MTTELGTWLRAKREDQGWSRSDIARRIITAAKETGDDSLPSVENLRQSVYRWETGRVDLSGKYRLLYCRVFSIKPAEFGPQPGAACDAGVIQPVAVMPARAGVPPRSLVAYGGIEACESKQLPVGQEVVMAAHEGSEHAARTEQHGIGDATLEQLRADLARLSQESDTGQPFTVFLDLRRVRDRVYQLLDRRLWPGEQADLYFILGCLNGLMGVAADRLGYSDSAEELMRSGWAYAIAIDHRPLLAALRTRLSSVAYWRGMHRKGLDLAADGLRYATTGPAAADLHLKYAQAAAQLGDAEAARRAVAAAHDAADRDHHDDLLEIGGEFALSRASHHYFAGAALIGLPDAEREAAAEIERAVELYGSGPAQGEQFSFEAKARASTDLARVRLHSGELDAAIIALEPVLALPPEDRVTSVMTRMRLVRMELAAPVFRGTTLARELDGRLEEFGRDTVAAGLHALPAYPA